MPRLGTRVIPMLCAVVAVDLSLGESILHQPGLSEPCGGSELHQPDRLASGVLEFYGDLTGFNAAAGSPLNTRRRASSISIEPIRLRLGSRRSTTRETGTGCSIPR